MKGLRFSSIPADNQRMGLTTTPLRNSGAALCTAYKLSACLCTVVFTRLMLLTEKSRWATQQIIYRSRRQNDKWSCSLFPFNFHRIKNNNNNKNLRFSHTSGEELAEQWPIEQNKGGQHVTAEVRVANGESKLIFAVVRKLLETPWRKKGRKRRHRWRRN